MKALLVIVMGLGMSSFGAIELSSDSYKVASRMIIDGGKGKGKLKIEDSNSYDVAKRKRIHRCYTDKKGKRRCYDRRSIEIDFSKSYRVAPGIIFEDGGGGKGKLKIEESVDVAAGPIDTCPVWQRPCGPKLKIDVSKPNA